MIGTAFNPTKEADRFLVQIQMQCKCGVMFEFTGLPRTDEFLEASAAVDGRVAKLCVRPVPGSAGPVN